MVFIYIHWGEQAIEFATNPRAVRGLVDRYPVRSRVIFFLAVFLQIVIAIIPGEPFELAAGYAFGWFEGTVICMAAIYVASILIFWAVKRWGRPVIELFFEPEAIDDVRLFRNEDKFNFLMFILMFIPGTPKDILTYLAGLTPMKLSMWLLIISTRIVSVVTSTVSGSLVGAANYRIAAIVFGASAVVALIGILVYRYFNRRAKDADAQRIEKQP